MRYLITGGCGFIGSHFIRLILEEDTQCEVTNVDLLTYAGREENLDDVIVAHAGRYCLIREDIAEAEVMSDIFRDKNFSRVLMFMIFPHF